jgi:hypothetical protein
VEETEKQLGTLKKMMSKQTNQQHLQLRRAAVVNKIAKEVVRET